MGKVQHSHSQCVTSWTTRLTVMLLLTCMTCAPAGIQAAAHQHHPLPRAKAAFMGFAGGDGNQIEAIVMVYTDLPWSNDAQVSVIRDSEFCSSAASRYLLQPVQDWLQLNGQDYAWSRVFSIVSPDKSHPLPNAEQKLRLCLSRWMPLDVSHFSLAPPDHSGEEEDVLSRSQRSLTPVTTVGPLAEDEEDNDEYEDEIEHHPTWPPSALETPNHHARILAIQLQEITKDVKSGVITARQGFEVKLNVYGFGLTNWTEVKLSSTRAEAGSPCKTVHGLNLQTDSYFIQVDEASGGTSGSLVIPQGVLPVLKGGEMLFVCLRNGPHENFKHQGQAKSLRIEVYELLLPIWVMIIFIIVLLCLSGLFSGLNLGLMALDQTELKIVRNCGTDREKSYAEKIAPVRAHGNFLLCSLLLGNVLVNNTLTILLDALTSGIVAVIGATLGIVVFGEIVPQAICSRHGLAIGAYTIWLTKFFMLLTCPLAFPISKLLDKALGDEIGTVYNKKKLIELLRVTRGTTDLEKEEVDIVTGALVYKDKTVRSVMTALEDCYMLDVKTVLNFDTIAEIGEQGYSRIPVYDGIRSNIVYVLFVKDLMFVDPDNDVPLKEVCEFYKNDVNFVFHDTPLNIMFNEFKSGEKGHMAFVQEVNTSGEGDPFYETVGLITLEDIIEEIIQQEIVDETDVILDNRTKKRRVNLKTMLDNSKFVQHYSEPKRVIISPQLTLAVFQYLSTSLEPFKSVHLSDDVLKRLLSLDIFCEIKIKKSSGNHNNNKIKRQNEDDLFIVNKGVPIDFFILIIEGRVQATVGREELVFESGPFTYFGLQVLLHPIVESPPSPIMAIAHKNGLITPTSMSGGQGHEVIVSGVITPGTTTTTSSSKMAPLRKASTQLNVELPSSSSLGKRAGSLTASLLESAANLPLISRNNSLAPSMDVATSCPEPPFVPDYSIKAVTDLLYMKLKRTTYLRALKASQMTKKSSQGGDSSLDPYLDRYLCKVNEDDTDAEMPSTPIMNSPASRKSLPRLQQDKSYDRFASRNDLFGSSRTSRNSKNFRLHDTSVDSEDFQREFKLNRLGSVEAEDQQRPDTPQPDAPHIS